MEEEEQRRRQEEKEAAEQRRRQEEESAAEQRRRQQDEQLRAELLEYARGTHWSLRQRYEGSWLTGSYRTLTPEEYADELYDQRRDRSGEL